MKQSENTIQRETFSEPLLRWYDKNKRDFLWRDHLDPYYVWISEIMLQQTRIEAAQDYFLRFTEELPDIQSLATVPEERLMKLWEGLGYYNRARNLQKAAKMLMEEHGGKLPADYEKLLALPGIGPYTAGAIASISYGISVPAVDGNVLRVVMRYLKCDDDISKMSVRRRVEQMLLEAMPERPGDFNQAIMELGEVVCIPNGAPQCNGCPIQGGCGARACSCQEDYPKKAIKKARRIERRSILVYECNGLFGIVKRPEKGLLAGLYEFPSLEGRQTAAAIRKGLMESGISQTKVTSMGTAKHIFSHIEWHMKGFHIQIDKSGMEKLSEQVLFVSREELRQVYTLPVAFHYYLDQIMERE